MRSVFKKSEILMNDSKSKYSLTYLSGFRTFQFENSFYIPTVKFVHFGLPQTKGQVTTGVFSLMFSLINIARKLCNNKKYKFFSLNS